MRKKNVLHLTVGLAHGGAEKVLLDASVQFKKNGNINSQVISFSNELGLLDDYVDHQIKVTPLKKDNSFKSFFEIASYSNSFVRSENIDIIHAHMFHAMLIAAILKICNPKIKVIFTSHNVNLGSHSREFLIYLLKPLRNIDILFSPNMKRYFHKSQNSIIQNAVNAEEFKGQSDKFEKFTFLAVGHLREAKNYPFLLQCAKELKESFDFQLLIAGEGKLRYELEEGIQKERLEENVFLLGNIENISELLQQSHCLVMPSLWEGMPLAILEAGVCRLPVISTPVGSIPSVLNGDNAYVVAPDEFVDMMVEVYRNYPDAQKKAERLHDQVIQNHSVEKMVKKLEDLYLSI